MNDKQTLADLDLKLIDLLDKRASLIKAQNIKNDKIASLSNLLKSYLENKNNDEKSFECTYQGHKDLVIVGGLGALGSLFAKFFKKSGYSVKILDKDDWDKAQGILSNAHIVIICVPIELTKAVIKRVCSYIDDNTILCDLTSTKAMAVKAMQEHHQGPIISLHPMFGPDISSFNRQVIAYIPVRQSHKADFLIEQLKLWGAHICPCSSQEHDELMSIIQALRHFNTISYGIFLSKLKPSLKKILALSSPIYHLEILMVGRLFAQNPSLYAHIIMSQDQNLNIIKEYIKSSKDLLEIIKNKDLSTFLEQFALAHAYFGDNAVKFMEQSQKLLMKFQDERNTNV